MANPLLNSSLPEISVKLAAIAVQARRARREKQAGAFDGMLDTAQQGLSGAYNAIKDSPTAIGGLAGAGIGGLAGGLSSLGQDPERRTTGSNIMSGALAGGIAGAGGGLAYSHFNGGEPAPTPAAPIKFQHQGQEFNLDPKKVAENPGIADKIKELQTPDPIAEGVGTIGDAAKGYAEEHPYLTGLMGADAANSTIGRVADKLNPAGGSGSINPAQFKNNLMAYLEKTKLDTVSKGSLDALKTMPNDQIQQMLAAAKGGGQGLPQGITPQILRDIQGMGGGRAGFSSALQELISKGRSAVGMEPLGPMAGTGYRFKPPLYEAAGEAADGITDMARSAAGGVEQSPGIGGKIMRGIESAGPLGTKAKILGRAGVYGGIPLLEWYLKHRQEQNNGMAELQKLLQQNATPAQ